MQCDPMPVDSSKIVHSGQLCTVLHSILRKEGKQCRGLQLSKRCFYCMRDPTLLPLCLLTVCRTIITLCPAMGVLGPGTGVNSS